jgi:chaperonin GroES
MRPTDDRLFVKPLPHAEATESGLIIPDAAKGKQTKGEVTHVGDALDDHGKPLITCVVGDHILYPENAGMEFNYHDVDMKVIRWGDVQAILDRDVKSAEEVIKASGSFDVVVVETQFKGTIKERLLVNICGEQFFLQGNIFTPFAMDVTKPTEPEVPLLIQP